MNYEYPSSAPHSPSFSTNYELLRLAGSIPLTGTGKERTEAPFLLPSLIDGNYRSNSLPLLDYCLPFGDDRPVVLPWARRSKPLSVPLPNCQDWHGSNRPQYNKSLHPILSVGPAFASCSFGAANAGPPAKTGELNRYGWPLLRTEIPERQLRT